MKKLTKLLLALVIAIGMTHYAKAENYPYRSDVLWLTVPNNSNWLYKLGEKATVEIGFYKYGIPRDAVVNYAIGPDMRPAETKGSVKLKNGKGTINLGTMKKPGFKDCVLTTSVDGKTYTHHVKVGFAPKQLKPYTKNPDALGVMLVDKYNPTSDQSQYPGRSTVAETYKFIEDNLSIAASNLSTVPGTVASEYLPLAAVSA